MANSKGSFFDLKVVIGLLVLIFGILLLLRNMGYDIGMDLWRWWPVILVLFGLRIMIQPRENRQYTTGAVLLVLGVLLILNNLDVFHLTWGIIWSLVIILIGISIVYNHLRHPGKSALGYDDIDLSMILGGGEFRFDSKELRGGKISAIIGGGKIDLRDADMTGDEIVIDTFTLMGGIEVWVPTSWQVVMRGTPILGGMENKTALRPSAGQISTSKKLIITGTSIMGGIKVTN